MRVLPPGTAYTQGGLIDLETASGDEPVLWADVSIAAAAPIDSTDVLLIGGPAARSGEWLITPIQRR